ncbi:Maf family nucleotide pyrophosphatase [Candidatus Omnitrophota bacterium]
MKKIYLASDSRRRRYLLKKLGLKFKVIPSRVKERRKKGNLTYLALVKGNALKKAQDVAKRVKGGLIIGADTIVVQEGSIFGKPKDLKAARRMLKKLSRRPQWIYTGLAVIDKDKGKTISDYEKSKVYMDDLSDQAVRAYFSRVSPLDKAGGFDVQGPGARFIRRIEGSFYNVVGLPLKKLSLILKKLDIKPKPFFLLILGLCFSLSACSTEYNIVTGKEELYYYSTDREVQIGRSIAKQIQEDKETEPAEDPLIQERVEDIGKRIATVCDRKDIDYHFMVLEEDEVNAFALPGGFVYIYRGLIDKIENDDQLACVIAHEIGHIVARHSIKKLQAITGYSILRILTVAAPQGAQVGNAADLAFASIITGYAREDELLADRLGTRYAKMAGYDPRAMIDFLEKLQEINRRKPLRPKSYFKTHPYVPDRIRVVKQELGERIDFSDYINIEQLEGE